MLWTATIERAIEKLGRLVAGMAQTDKPVRKAG
jgi:hypothetical protein